MKLGQAEPVRLPEQAAGAPLATELLHLRYLVAFADAALLLWVCSSPCSAEFPKSSSGFELRSRQHA